MLYSVLLRCIERENYQNKEDLKNTIAILFTNGQLTKEEYEELINLLK